MFWFIRKRLVIALVSLCCAVFAMAKFSTVGKAIISNSGTAALNVKSSSAIDVNQTFVPDSLRAQTIARTTTTGPQYQIFDIGVVQVGDTASQGFGVSAGGTAVGRSFRSGGAQAFYWTNGGGIVGLPNLPERSYAVANSAVDTDAGTVVGTAATTSFGSGRLPVKWHGGVIEQLTLPPGQTLGDANDINTFTIAVGSVNAGSLQRGAIYGVSASSVIINTTSNGSYFVTAFGINDSGRIVGQGADPTNAARNVGIVYDMGSDNAIEVGALPGFNGALAFAVSNAGHVVGSSMLNQGSGLPFIWTQAGGIVAIPLAAGTSQGSARAVNSSGWAVGNASSAFSIPFLYDGTTTYRLQDIIPTGSGWDLSMNTSSSALGIGDNGVIVGTGVRNGETHAYAMVPAGPSTPTDTPTATNTPTTTSTPTNTPTSTPTATPPQTSIQFSSATYMEDESQVASITITRTGNLANTNSVLFVTPPGGTATAGSACTSGVDYVIVDQPVTFTPGVTTQTVNVTICADIVTEPDQTVNLALIGAAVGTPATAILTINDTASAFRNAASITINDLGAASPYPSTITVPGGSAAIGSMRVTIYDLSTNIPEFADFLLVGPGGQEFILMASSGGVVAAGPVTLNFSDAAGAVVPDNGPIATGDFEPTSYGTVSNFPTPAPSGPYNLPGGTVGGTGTQTLFGNFGGTNSNGVWSLYVRNEPSSLVPTGAGSVAGGWGIEFLGSTAAGASISGRVKTADGLGIRNAKVIITGNSLSEPRFTMTGSFGYFSFDGLATGETYVVTVNSRRYAFSTPSRVISLVDNISDADFVADPLE